MPFSANHATGQTIQAADINAIETALNAYVNVQREYASDVGAAINALPSTGGTLYCPAGTYTWPSGGWSNSGVGITKPVRIVGDGPGSTIFQGPSSVYPFYLTGSITAWASRILLTADAPRYPTAATGWLPKITLASAAGIAAGDWLLLGSDDPWPGTLQSTTRGEYVRVHSVATNVVTLRSDLNDSYTVATGAHVRKVTFPKPSIIEGVTFQNTTPAAGTVGFILAMWLDRLTVRSCEMIDCDERGVYLRDCIRARVKDIDMRDFMGNGSLGSTYGVSLMNASQWCTVEGINGDRLWDVITTNGTANPGVPRFNTCRNSVSFNPFATSFSAHEEGEFNIFEDLTTVGGYEQSSAMALAGMSVRANNTIVKNFAAINGVARGFWYRAGITGLIADGITIRNQHWVSYAGSSALLIDGDQGIIRNVVVDGVDDVGISVTGNSNFVEGYVKRSGLQGTATPTTGAAVQFSSSNGGSNNTVILRGARDCPLAVGADSGVVTGNTVHMTGDLVNTAVGTTTWVKESAGYGKAPTAKAAAITSPTADVTALKTAVDAVRTALANYGITA